MMLLNLFSDETIGRQVIQAKGSADNCKESAERFLDRFRELPKSAPLQWRDDSGGNILGFIEDESLPFKEKVLFIIKPLKENPKAVERKQTHFVLTIKVKEMDTISEIKSDKSIGSYSVFNGFVQFDLTDGFVAFPQENVVWFKVEKIEE